MENSLIAHDLAVAKLYGSDLPTDELIKTYRQYNDEILSNLKNEPNKANPAKILKSPI